jgi:translocation and assembly module TamB
MPHLKQIGRWTLVLVVCGSVFLGAAILLLSSNFTHRYALALIMQRIQDAVGARVEIQNLSFHRTNLGADFYGIRIRGTESDQRTPLFAADRVSVGLGIHLFQRKKIDLQEVTIDRPVTHLSIDSTGKSNMPRSRNSPSGSTSSIFDMAIGHFVLNNGEVFYNDRHAMVSADVRNLDSQVSYSQAQKSYDGTLSYRQARIHYGSLAPFTHDLLATFSAAPSGLVLKSLTLQSRTSTIRAHGQMTNYSEPSFDGSYEARVSTRELSELFRNSAIPEGQIDTEGAVAYKLRTGEPVINALSLSGNLRGRSLNEFLPEVRATFQSVAAEYHLDRGNLEVRKVKADVLGGHVTGNLLISHLADDAAARLEVGVQDVSLSAVQDAVRTEHDLGFQTSGKVEGRLEATWHGSLLDPQMFSDAKITGSITSASTAKQSSLSFPIDATAQVTYDGRKHSAVFHNASLHTPHSNLTLEGGLGRNADLRVEARSDDLREIDLLAVALQANSSVASGKYSGAPQPLDLAGAANFNGTINGELDDPRIEGVLSGTTLRVRGISVRTFRTSLQLSRNGITAHQGEIRTGLQAGANFDVSLGLRDWHFAPDRPLNIHLSAEGLPLSDIEHIAGLPYPVSGLLSANLTIGGTQENPDAHGNIRVSEATAWEQPIQSLTIGLQNSGNDLRATLDLRMPAGSASSTLVYNPKTRQYEVKATAMGLRLDQVQYFEAHSQKIAGFINASAEGRGDLNAPQLGVAVDGQLQIGNQKIDGFRAQGSVAKQRSDFTLNCSVSGATLQAHGAVNLTGDYDATVNIDSQVIQLDSLLSTFLPQTNTGLHGQSELHGTLRGPLKDPNKLEAHIEVPSMSIGYSSLQIAAVEPIRADYRGGILAIQQTRLKGTGTDLRLEAAVPIQSPSALRVTANGNIDLELLQIWNPQWKSSGQIALNVGAQGSRAHPELNGTIGISNAGLSVENLPALEKIRGQLDVNGERIQVKDLTGQIGGGSFEIHGFAAYQPNVRYNLGMTAKGVRVLYPEGIRSQLDADLNFTGQPNKSYLAGQVVVNHLSLTQSFDLANFTEVFGGPSSPAAGMAEKINLNVGVSSSRALEVSSNQLSVQGTADLHLQGTLAEPVLIGRTNVTAGELFFNGKRFQIQNATIAFANSVRTAPVVNLTATTTVSQFNLTVNLMGPLDKLRTTYTSDPPLSEVDVINLLITGHTTAQASSVSAQSVVASQVGGQVSNRLEKLTGISSLTIDPQIGGNQGNAGSRLAIQQRVTKNLFFTFATDVTTTQGAVVQVEYQVTPKYSVSAIRNQTGGYQIEIKSHKTF